MDIGAPRLFSIVPHTIVLSRKPCLSSQGQMLTVACVGFLVAWHVWGGGSRFAAMIACSWIGALYGFGVHTTPTEYRRVQ